MTTPYAFDPEQSRRLAEAGADIVVAHMGLTTKGSIGAKTAKTLDDCVREVTDIARAGKAVRGDLLVLCHGGPIASPDDAQFILDRVPEVDGFYGASSMERLPTELAIAQQVRGLHGAEARHDQVLSPHCRGANPCSTNTSNSAAASASYLATSIRRRLR